MVDPKKFLLAAPPPSTLKLHDFFDNERKSHGRVTDTCSTPDPEKYHDPATQTLTLGTTASLAARMSSRNGVRGTVIPRSTRDGVSRGWDPKQPPHKKIIVDAIVAGGALEVDLSLVDKDTARLAWDRAGQLVPEVASMEHQRLRQSAYYHALVEMGCGRPLYGSGELVRATLGAGSAPGMTPIDETPPLGVSATQLPPDLDSGDGSRAAGYPGPRPEVPAIKAASFADDRSVLPEPRPGNVRAATFAAAAPALETPLDPRPPVHQPWQVPQPAGSLLSAFGAPGTPTSIPEPARALDRMDHAPTTRVVFDTPLGELESDFHGAVQHGLLLALIYDNRYSGPRTTPRILTQKPDGRGPEPGRCAVHVRGSDVVFLVESTGELYEFDGRTHYILFVVDRKPYRAG